MNWRLFLPVVLLFLTSCASYLPASFYSLSEQQLEQNLLRKLSDYNSQGKVMGFKLALNVNDISAKIGSPTKPQGIILNLDSTAKLNALALQIPVRVKLALAGMPVYNASEKAVFLTQFEVIDIDVDAMGYRGKLAPLSKEVKRLIANAVAAQPLYELNMNDPKQALLSKMNLQLTVQPQSLSLKGGL